MAPICTSSRTACGGHDACGVKHGSCRLQATAAATCNLYVSHNGELRFIATLSAEDALDWGTSFLHRLQLLVARVSGNGLFAAFTSVRPLTGYDNRDARSGKPDAEIFEYDATTERLLCASCNPTGARPDGREVKSFEAGNNLADVFTAGSGESWSPASWAAANMPSDVELNSGYGLYRPHLLAESGRLFFNSSDALVPSDTNEQEDAYEFEPVGAGGCAAEASTFHASTGGCTALVSSGTSSEESALLDASVSGDDVFFLTAERLVPEDTDASLDVYDAHVCTTGAPCPAPTAAGGECVTADACRAAPSPQPSIFGTASTDVQRPRRRRAGARAEDR